MQHELLVAERQRREVRRRRDQVGDDVLRLRRRLDRRQEPGRRIEVRLHRRLHRIVAVLAAVVLRVAVGRQLADRRLVRIRSEVRRTRRIPGAVQVVRRSRRVVRLRQRIDILQHRARLLRVRLMRIDLGLQRRDRARIVLLGQVVSGDGALKEGRAPCSSWALKSASDMSFGLVAFRPVCA